VFVSKSDKKSILVRPPPPSPKMIFPINYLGGQHFGYPAEEGNADVMQGPCIRAECAL
jgi:hypothetical protein